MNRVALLFGAGLGAVETGLAHLDAIAVAYKYKVRNEKGKRVIRWTTAKEAIEKKSNGTSGTFLAKSRLDRAGDGEGIKESDDEGYPHDVDDREDTQTHHSVNAAFSSLIKYIIKQAWSR